MKRLAVPQLRSKNFTFLVFFNSDLLMPTKALFAILSWLPVDITARQLAIDKGRFKAEHDGHVELKVMGSREHTSDYAMVRQQYRQELARKGRSFVRASGHSVDCPFLHAGSISGIIFGVNTGNMVTEAHVFHRAELMASSGLGKNKGAIEPSQNTSKDGCVGHYRTLQIWKIRKMIG
ncbi:hypothetical protein EVAR_72828_1 [Eumeta japonica]|uniref:Uncharacterized protein n=1 Tax=Eumeta variegata TaxID=151549 RepID=A0A4C1T826_EUMVA|nr:hypothetical protein EVAR_72828_1 [Eumeta japonica]